MDSGTVINEANGRVAEIGSGQFMHRRFISLIRKIVRSTLTSNLRNITKNCDN